jgi:hypothetical protein
MTGSSADISPPAWQSRLDPEAESELVASSFAAMAEILPALRWVDVRRLDGLQVKGGIIVAWGKTDIDDPASELHQRFAIGITASDAYFSIDPGKLCVRKGSSYRSWCRSTARMANRRPFADRSCRTRGLPWWCNLRGSDGSGTRTWYSKPPSSAAPSTSASSRMTT